jgi:hypothetical protein
LIWSVLEKPPARAVRATPAHANARQRLAALGTRSKPSGCSRDRGPRTQLRIWSVAFPDKLSEMGGCRPTIG